jgi:class 3 adenylate cyclase
MCAVFASPRAAVDAAVAAQWTLEWPVRMGIATGEAELRRDDYFGTVLNRTARVMSAGHGGQILLDGATAVLLSGIDLIALGPRRLRDIAKPVEICQVRAPVVLNTTITRLREVLGDDAYESLAQAGEAMTPAAMATYAFDQIDRARAALLHP